jgi:hypothetical protein
MQRDERHEQRSDAQSQSLAMALAMAILARKEVRKCVECGAEFIALCRHQLYCSARCRRRRAMREYYRRKRERHWSAIDD